MPRHCRTPFEEKVHKRMLLLGLIVSLQLGFLNLFRELGFTPSMLKSVTSLLALAQNGASANIRSAGLTLKMNGPGSEYGNYKVLACQIIKSGSSPPMDVHFLCLTCRDL